MKTESEYNFRLRLSENVKCSHFPFSKNEKGAVHTSDAPSSCVSLCLTPLLCGFAHVNKGVRPARRLNVRDYVSLRKYAKKLPECDATELAKCPYTCRSQYLTGNILYPQDL